MGCRVTLSEICDINASQYSTKEAWPRIQYLDTGNVTRGVIFELQQLDPLIDKVPSRARRKVKPNSIVYSMVRPNQGHYALLKNPPIDMLVSTGFSVIDADKSQVLPSYLYYALTTKGATEGFQALAEQRVSTYPTLSSADLLAFEVILPPLKYQQQVAAVLERIDEKMAVNAKLNGYLEELARAMYVSVMQEHADIASLCDMAEFNPETYSPKENWSAVSYIDTSALTLNDLAGLQHFNPAEEKLPTRARRKVSDGDILYSTVRPNQNHYGLLYNPEPHALASSAFAVIRPNDTIMSPLIYLALTDARITKTLQQLAETSTSTIPSIRPADLEQIAVLVPSDEYGNEIASQIETTFKQIDCNKRENRKLTALRDALLPKLMSGEINVSTVDLTQLNSHLV